MTIVSVISTPTGRPVSEKNALTMINYEEFMQDGVLEEILKRNGETEYLKRFGLEGKTDRLTFKEKLPVLTYENLQMEIQRIANGDRSPILSSHPISEFFTRKFLLEKINKLKMESVISTLRGRPVSEKDAEKLRFIEELIMDADKVQEGVLEEILKRNEYLKRFGLEGKPDRLTFNEKVQMLMYEDLGRPVSENDELTMFQMLMFQRIANGDQSPILSSHPIFEFLIRKKENMVKGGRSDMLTISAMTGIVAFVAGYITTSTGQKALDIATQQAWYLAPTNVFAFFMLASLFFAVMSKRFPRLEDYSAVCMTFACCSIARIILQCPGGLTWIVYVPCAIVAFFLVIPDRVHRFLFNGLGAIITRLMGWINGTSLIIASCAMAIHERFAGIRHEELPK